MKVINDELIIKYLKENEFGFYGIPKNDEASNNKDSIEPVAIVAFVLAKIGALTDTEKKNYIDRILAAKHESGAFFTVHNILGVWATSQACLALHELGCEEEKYRDSIMWLCKCQNKDGGWSYNGIYNLSAIIHSFYTVLLLRKFRGIDKVDEALRRNACYLKGIRDNAKERAVNRLMSLYLLEINGEKQTPEIRDSIINNYIAEIIVSKKDETFIDIDLLNNNSYYIGFYFPAAYLLVRRFRSPKDYFSQFLINHLLVHMNPEGCWGPSDGKQGPASWATALSLYTIFTWEKDCLSHDLNTAISLSEEALIIELRHELEEQRMNNVIVKRCPLNQGVCNQLEKIQKNYNEKNVFLDIPYDKSYLDFENKIVKTLKQNGLNPVMAKDINESSILLCTICEMIQSCKYGIADLTGARENVYFELGLLYGTSRNCALLKNRDVKIPADLKGKRYIEYSNTVELGEELTLWIQSCVDSQKKQQ